MTSIRGNTTLTVWPKPPPARREGSSILFTKCCIQSPRTRYRDKRMIRPATRIIRLSLSGLYFVRTKTLLDCPARAAAACSRRSNDLFASTASKRNVFAILRFEAIPLCQCGRNHRPPGVRAVPDYSRSAVFKSPRTRYRDKRMIRATGRIARLSLSGLYFVRR